MAEMATVEDAPEGDDLGTAAYWRGVAFRERNRADLAERKLAVIRTVVDSTV